MKTNVATNLSDLPDSWQEAAFSPPPPPSDLGPEDIDDARLSSAEEAAVVAAYNRERRG